MTEKNIQRYLFFKDGKIDRLSEMIGLNTEWPNDEINYIKLTEKEYHLLKLFDGDLVEAIECARELMETLEMLLN